MLEIVGKYLHKKNENLENYLRAEGVSVWSSMWMVSQSPQLDISVDDEQWTIKLPSFIWPKVLKFKLGEEYEERKPGGGTIKNTTTREGNALITVFIERDGSKVLRTYEFSDTHCIIHMKHEKSGKEAKCYFQRAA